MLLLGGTPFGEELVMWWNFVGRSHDDIVDYRRMWEDNDERFGAVDGYRGPCPPARSSPAERHAAAPPKPSDQGAR